MRQNYHRFLVYSKVGITLGHRSEEANYRRSTLALKRKMDFTRKSETRVSMVLGIDCCPQRILGKVVSFFCNHKYHTMVVSAVFV